MALSALTRTRRLLPLLVASASAVAACSRPLSSDVDLVVAPGPASTIETPAAAAPSSPFSVINHAAAEASVVARPVRRSVSMLDGAGGNIAALTTPDTVFLVDIGIAASREKIESALKPLSPSSIDYVVNTHWHWDHAEGNGWGRSTGAKILASANTVKQLQQPTRVVEWDHTFEAIGTADLPNQIVTAEMKMTVGDESIVIRPYPPSHTGGDLSVYFTKADVLATGDTFWNGAFPFIDYVAGGSINGAIKAAEANLAMTGADTLYVPGHGPIANRQDAQAFRDMLVTIRDRVASLKASGKSLSQAQAEHPTAEFDAKWGQSVINGDLFTALVWKGV